MLDATGPKSGFHYRWSVEFDEWWIYWSCALLSSIFCLLCITRPLNMLIWYCWIIQFVHLTVIIIILIIIC